MGVNGIYGLSGSGMDIDSLVKVGMMGRQKEYDKMAQKYTKNEWTKAAYLTLNSSITTFNMSTLSQYKMSSTMNAKTAESNSSAVKVSANGGTPVMTHQVEVTGLSANAYLISQNELKRVNRTSGSIDSTSLKLKDLLFTELKQTERDTGQVDADGNAIMEKIDEVTGSFKAGNNKTYTFSNDSTQGAAAHLADKAISFYIGDGSTTNADGTTKTVEISYTFDEILNGDVTINDVVSKINSAGLNVRASFDTVNEKFFIYNNKGGSDNTIFLQAGANDKETRTDPVTGESYTYTNNFAGSVATTLLNGLGLQQSKNGELTGNVLKFTATNAKNTVPGEDGSIKVDGVTYTTTENKATVNGITYTALAETGGTPAVVTVSQDVDAIVDKVKGFIEDYNKLLSSLYEKYDEKPETGYAPLTQSQKDAMKEEQITKWEEKAQKGLLYHDQTLGKIINEMRGAITETVEGLDGKYNSVFSLGISTTGIKGQLVLNEDKLRAALAEDSDAVYNVFARLDTSVKDSSGNIVNNPAGNGIAQRLGDILSTASKNIKSRAGSTTAITEDSDLNNLLRQLQTKMSNFKKLMSSFEDKLYKKYDTMESTLAKLGAQLSFISGGQ